MSSLVTMAVYDTEENERSPMTRITLETLRDTVDFGKHTLMISDNGSCEETHALYKEFENIIGWISFNGENIGTAKALNLLWRLRQPYQRCVVKIDNDVRIHRPGWLDVMESVFDKDRDIGICGLKRRDLAEWPIQTTSQGMQFYLSKLRPLPHKMGEPWLIVEECNHIMGTCQAYSRECLNKLGFLYQPGPYGFDDSLASLRAHIAGFKTVFLHGIEDWLEHVDPGGTDFIEWKKQEAGRRMAQYNEARAKYQSGEWEVYYDGGYGNG